MPLYRAVIAPCSSFASPLQGDTLFGAFCWSYLRRRGEAGLRELLEHCRAQRPPVIFSNGFPTGTFPLPCGVFDEANQYETIESKAQRREAYRRNKTVKNARYVKADAFWRIVSGDRRGFTGDLRGEGSIPGETMHNMVSRDSDTVENLDGAGNLFVSEETFSDTAYDCYILSTLDAEELRNTLDLMLTLGIGADKSTGKGAFRLEDFSECGFPAPETANGFVALSNFIPASHDPVEGSYKTFVKFPKLDREFAGSDMPFKKPMLFLKCGAAFRTNEIRPFYGRCVSGVSLRNPDILLNACTIAVPAILP